MPLSLCLQEGAVGVGPFLCALPLSLPPVVGRRWYLVQPPGGEGAFIRVFLRFLSAPVAALVSWQGLSQKFLCQRVLGGLPGSFPPLCTEHAGIDLH